jgi:hypothetical protein
VSPETTKDVTRLLFSNETLKKPLFLCVWRYETLNEKYCFLAKSCRKRLVFWQKVAARGFFRGAQRAFPWEMQKLSIFRTSNPALAVVSEVRARCAQYFFCPSKTKAHHQAR